MNGFNESQLNFSDFIDGFVDKNVADVTIDGNANAHHKDICSMLGEKESQKINYLHLIRFSTN